MTIGIAKLHFLLVKVQLIRLLIHQNKIPLNTAILWRQRTEVLRYRLPLHNIQSGNIDHQPMEPGTVHGILSVRSIGTDHEHGVEGLRIRVPVESRLELELRRSIGLALLYVNGVVVLDLVIQFDPFKSQR